MWCVRSLFKGLALRVYLYEVLHLKKLNHFSSFVSTIWNPLDGCQGNTY